MILRGACLRWLLGRAISPLTGVRDGRGESSNRSDSTEYTVYRYCVKRFSWLPRCYIRSMIGNRNDNTITDSARCAHWLAVSNTNALCRLRVDESLGRLLVQAKTAAAVRPLPIGYPASVSASCSAVAILCIASYCYRMVYCVIVLTVTQPFINIHVSCVVTFYRELPTRRVSWRVSRWSVGAWMSVNRRRPSKGNGVPRKMVRL